MPTKKKDAPSQPAFQRIATSLRDSIIHGRLQAGQPLAEQDLAAEWGISRNTLREALRCLHAQGLVDYQHNRGVSVRRLSKRDVRDIYKTRRHLEMMAIQSPETISAYHLYKMKQQLDLSNKAAIDNDWQAAGTYSLRFHQCLVHMLGSVRIDAFFTVLIAQQRLLFATGQYESDFQRPWLERDRQLWDLLSDQRVTEASQMLMTYLEESERQIMATFERYHGPQGV